MLSSKNLKFYLSVFFKPVFNILFVFIHDLCASAADLNLERV